MTSKSYFRGHLIKFVDGCWVYADNNIKTFGGGEIRPCKKCGASYALGKPDPCIGTLPGVSNACCGHGIPEQAYVSFTNGIILRYFDVTTNNEEVNKKQK